jgi:hypothetical protein
MNKIVGRLRRPHALRTRRTDCWIGLNTEEQLAHCNWLIAIVDSAGPHSNPHEARYASAYRRETGPIQNPLACGETADDEPESLTPEGLACGELTDCRAMSYRVRHG